MDFETAVEEFNAIYAPLFDLCVNKEIRDKILEENYITPLKDEGNVAGLDCLRKMVSENSKYGCSCDCFYFKIQGVLIDCNYEDQKNKVYREKRHADYADYANASSFLGFEKEKFDSFVSMAIKQQNDSLYQYELSQKLFSFFESIVPVLDKQSVKKLYDMVKSDELMLFRLDLFTFLKKKKVF